MELSTVTKGLQVSTFCCSHYNESVLWQDEELDEKAPVGQPRLLHRRLEGVPQHQEVGEREGEQVRPPLDLQGPDLSWHF